MKQNRALHCNIIGNLVFPHTKRWLPGWINNISCLVPLRPASGAVSLVLTQQIGSSDDATWEPHFIAPQELFGDWQQMEDVGLGEGVEQHQKVVRADHPDEEADEIHAEWHVDN